MKTSISLVFNLVQIFISTSSRHEHLALHDPDCEDFAFASAHKDPAVKRSFANVGFKRVLAKYIPFLVTLLKFYNRVDEADLAALESALD